MAVTAPCAGLAGEGRAPLGPGPGRGLRAVGASTEVTAELPHGSSGQDSKVPVASCGQNMDCLFSPEMFLENLSLVLPGQQLHLGSENCGGLMCVFVCLFLLKALAVGVTLSFHVKIARVIMLTRN